MNKKIWMLLIAAICGTSSLVTANECSGCETTPVNSEEKKADETNSPAIAAGEAPAASEAPAAEE